MEENVKPEEKPDIQARESVKVADKTSQLGEKSIVSLMAQYSLPAIVAMIVQSTYHLINMSFVGQNVGPLGIAAIAVSGPITMIQGALNQFVCNGCSAAVSIKLGEGDREGARELLGSSVLFNMIVAITNVILGHIFITQLLSLFGASEAIMPYAREYLDITLYGMVFGGFTAMNPMMRIEGYPTRAMITMLLSTFVNLIFSPTFIFVFKMGIRGAALGTLCAQFATAMWLFLFLIGENRTVPLRIRYMRLKIRNLLRVMQLGLPTFLMQLTQSMLSVVMNRSLGTYGGDVAISAWGITNNISNLVAQPVFGMNQGAQPIIGYNIGAKNHKRVRQALTCSLVAACLFSFLGWALTRIFPTQLFAFFNDDPSLIAVGTHMMIVFRALIFVTGFQQAGASYFQYSGKPKISIFLTLSRQVLFLLPCVVILPMFFQFEGILYSGPISDLISTLITAGYIIAEFKRLKRLERETAFPQDIAESV